MFLSGVIQRKMKAEKQLLVFIIKPISKCIYNQTKLVKVILNRVNRGKKSIKCSIK